MSEPTQLKPCQFCGGEAEMSECNAGNYICCVSCRIVTEPLGTEDEARDAWNNREANRCATCRHGRDPKKLAPDGMLFCYRTRTMGPDDRLDPDSLAYVGFPSATLVSGLIVSPRFGCVQWEGK